MISEDKRKYERIQSLNLSYICLDEDRNIVKQSMGRTLNISESGLLLETHLPIETTHIVKMTIGLEEELLEITGKPVHISGKKKGIYEIGIQFTDLDQHSSRILKKFISDCGIRKDPLIEEED